MPQEEEGTGCFVFVATIIILLPVIFALLLVLAKWLAYAS